MNEWTTEIPKQGGLYWAWDQNYPDMTEPMLVDVSVLWNGEIIIYRDDYCYRASDFTHWMRAELPELPKVVK